MYTPQDYLLFFLAIALFLGVLALLGTVIDWREDRKTRQRDAHRTNKNEHHRHAVALQKKLYFVLPAVVFLSAHFDPSVFLVSA